MKTQIFLSYSRKDRTYMNSIKSRLEQEKIIAWTDEHLEPGTESWKMTIQEEIENSLLAVVLLSPYAKMSQWVNREISFAQLQEKRVIPLLIHGTPKYSIPFSLSDAHLIDCRSDLTSALESLIITIRREQKQSKETIRTVQTTELVTVEELEELEEPSLEFWEDFTTWIKDDAYAVAMYALTLEANELRLGAMRELRKALMMEPRIRLKKWTEAEFGWKEVHHKLFERIVMDTRYWK